MIYENIVEARKALLYTKDGVGVRITKEIARTWIANNERWLIGGYYFVAKIVHLGLGVYKATKVNETELTETRLVKA